MLYEKPRAKVEEALGAKQVGQCHLRNENDAVTIFEKKRLKWETDYQQSLHPSTERLEQEDQEF